MPHANRSLRAAARAERAHARARGRQAKAREIDKMDERAARLAEVLQELGSPPLPSY